MTPYVNNGYDLKTDLQWVVRNARAWDVREIEALVSLEFLGDNITEMYQNATFGTLLHAQDGTPVAFAMFHEVAGTTLAASMIATDRWPEVSKRFFRWGLKFFKVTALEIGYRRVECRTIHGNAEAIKMLEALGFKREADVQSYGRGGEDFWQYAWRLSDHVPLSPKTPKNP